jgi:hypothetical protein
MDEFYYQGDLEREAGVPITFAFDRYNPVPLPKFQLVRMTTTTDFAVLCDVLMCFRVS